MSHYWTSDDHPATRRAQARDWIEDLADFDVDCIRRACTEWRQTQRHRPTPADIRALAIAEQRRRAESASTQSLPPPRQNKRQPALNTWEFGYTERYKQSWFQELDRETQQRYMEQDMARADAWRRIGEAKTPEQRKSAEEAFERCCRAQVIENLSVPQFSTSRRPSDQDALRKLQDEMLSVREILDE